jgi:hypothetical protein
MTVTDTKYFREFLDFSFLWMKDNGKSVDENYHPSPSNKDLWRQLKQVCPNAFFEKCPIYFFGDLLSNPEQRVLSISLQPGRPNIIENREDELQVFSEFGSDGSTIINNARSYFPLVYGENGPNINAGNGFWRKIARIGHAAITGQSLNGNCQDWVFPNLVHVDFWPLRAESDNEYATLRDNNLLPVGFQQDDRKELLIELINAMTPRLSLVLGSKISLGLDGDRIDDAGAERAIYRRVCKYRGIANTFATVHPSRKGMSNNDLDEIGFAIYNKFQI